MRRILLLITDLEIGGTPTVVRELATRLHARRDVLVEVACLARPGPVATQLRRAGVHVSAFGARSPAELPNAVWKLVQLIRHGRFDTVFSFLIHANTVAAVASWFCRDVRFIQSIQTTQPHPRWQWWMQRLVHHAAECVVVPSPSAAQVAQDRAEVPPESVLVIPNAIDPADFPGSRMRSQRPPRRVGFIGRLDPVKRIPDLLRAIAALPPQFDLDIYGDGSQRGYLISLVDRLGITDRVRFHGTIAQPQRALARIELLVLPSEAEGFGLVLIEAMAAGVPVVATNVPGIRDVVRNERTGLLVPVASPLALAEAIRRVADDGALRESLVAHGLDDVRERFTWDVVFPQYISLLLPADIMRSEARTFGTAGPGQTLPLSHSDGGIPRRGR